MDESGDGWLRGSASRRAGVAQSPDGRRAITIFDPPLKEPCRDQHTVRARHPEGSSVSFARAGPHTSESRVTCRQRGGDRGPIQSQPPNLHTLPAGVSRPGFRPSNSITLRSCGEPGFQAPIKSQGELHPPGTPTFRDPSPSNPREEKGGSWHRTDGVPPEPLSPSWVTEPGSQWLPSVVPPGGLQSPKTPGAKGDHDTTPLVPPDEDPSLPPG